MAFVRTQVYLTQEQHTSLKEEARKQGVSLAEFLRCVVDEYLHQAKPKEEFMQIVALGRSGRRDVSEKHDKYVAEALKSKHVR
ncbi:MAG: hypothetical protein A2Z21_08975 [Candidatus Fraserbacteria bacterium RBG_16_55_9]|uniref:Ribbon-helix-helix protein CopG domain-containing protein n=1 Tax=Fraserbacteria sp. (strain RBG_16_55_9) TaxID=1817864 RepID=A0A1F5V268_FRAXR|nr:MAG: hypothetical protein A2Z21_08975 [Candidatus Fraserbacteria bacterium RBG_16_55_9]